MFEDREFKKVRYRYLGFVVIRSEEDESEIAY